MEERISKILSAHGVCSRRAAEELICAGRVSVNGETALLGQKADTQMDKICVDGKPIQKKIEYHYLMLHKPRGYVTTASDEKGRKTVLDLLGDYPARVWPVGRLDMDSEGLLLLTNDGDLTNRLIHPRHEIDKTYHVWVNGEVGSAITKLRNMTTLEGETIRKPVVSVLKKGDGRGILSITIHEGKYRQVRRMCAAAKLKVERLKRVREGEVFLSDLPMGKWRVLTEDEIALLKKD